MDIPRYWSKARGQVPGRKRGSELVAWGWSSHSLQEAEKVAQERLFRLIGRVRQGLPLPKGYAYGERPLREEIIEVVGENKFAPTAVITRTSYGSLILNTPNAMFVDVDLPKAPRIGFFAGLFGKAKPRVDEEAALGKLQGALESLSGSFRLYRTAAGWRVFVTDRPHAPRSNEAHDLMEAMGCDPSYQHLCRLQDCFRARLTPKPWRCGQSVTPPRYPREGKAREARFSRWLSRYERACRAKATCRFLETFHSQPVHPELRMILELHDSYTGIREDLPLA